MDNPTTPPRVAGWLAAWEGKTYMANPYELRSPEREEWRRGYYAWHHWNDRRAA